MSFVLPNVHTGERWIVILDGARHTAIVESAEPGEPARLRIEPDGPTVLRDDVILDDLID